jgi:hypothetical protein
MSLRRNIDRVREELVDIQHTLDRNWLTVEKALYLEQVKHLLEKEIKDLEKEDDAA